MNTAFILMAQYNGQAIIPLERVCRDYFNLTADQFQRKALAGQISLPIVRMEGGQKAAKGVHLTDLAQYIDARRSDAVRECETLNRRRA
ncbi:pyocin activator PrtN family protein [Azotobacter chroococcum]|uniref:pyocin activator PrtN family protein n=1 Tax=Azotobacter chroococcum TaxID=353 RepID=UPI0010AEC85E|nr:pyocin activator PrtN family protein [Azotobacter chroococcum]TKD45064.1 Pyocin activator protein PrtN [Azotobacter chroococcum]